MADDDPFVGGSPLAGALADRYRRPLRHNHAGQMVWPADPDGIVRHCWCAGCGQEWVVEMKPNGEGVPESKGWRPVFT